MSLLSDHIWAVDKTKEGICPGCLNENHRETWAGEDLREFEVYGLCKACMEQALQDQEQGLSPGRGGRDAGGMELGDGGHALLLLLLLGGGDVPIGLVQVLAREVE